MMLLWALKNWQTIVLGTALVALAGFVMKFYFDYTSLEKENTTLKGNVELLEGAVADQKLATEAALASANAFDAKLKEFEDDLQSLSEENGKIARRLSAVQRELSDADLENLVRRNPAQAGTTAGRILNDVGGLLVCASRGGTNCADPSPLATGETGPSTSQ